MGVERGMSPATGKHTSGSYLYLYLNQDHADYKRLAHVESLTARRHLETWASGLLCKAIVTRHTFLPSVPLAWWDELHHAHMDAHPHLLVGNCSWTQPHLPVQGSCTFARQHQFSVVPHWVLTPDQAALCLAHSCSDAAAAAGKAPTCALTLSYIFLT